MRHLSYWGFEQFSLSPVSGPLKAMPLRLAALPKHLTALSKVEVVSDYFQ